MKTTITAQQLVYFRSQGHIRFENIPTNFQAIQEKSLEKNDLWRKDPSLQKFILRTLGPIALELMGKKALRIACDRWIDTQPEVLRMQDMFSFQGLALIFVLLPSFLDIYEPSSLCSLLTPNSYLIAFGYDHVQFIENRKDPAAPALKKLGYGYGDLLKNEFHPLIFK